jgi:hypothetical protein
MTEETEEAWANIYTFLDKEEYPSGICGSCKHQVGIVGGGIPIEPEDSPIDGSAILKVHLGHVEMWVVPNPWGHNVWRKHAVQRYDTPEQLKEILDVHTDRVADVNCWGG